APYSIDTLSLHDALPISVFTIVGLALAYFQFRKREGRMISDTLNPVIGKGGKKPLRNAINILAVIATVLGVATSVGMGILQINRSEEHTSELQSRENLVC